MKLSSSRVILQSPETVWRLLEAVESWPQWTPTVTLVEPLGAKRLIIGARYRVKQPGLQTATYEVTELRPRERFTWTAKAPGLVMTADHTLTQEDNGTRVTLAYSLRGILAFIVWPLTRKKIAQFLEVEVECLKRNFEG